MNNIRLTHMSKPRLALSAIYNNGNEGLLGSFADGPRGRKDAAEELKDAFGQDDFLSRSIGHSRSTHSNGSPETHQYAGHLVQDIKINRMFADGSSQKLVRVPGQNDEYPQTLQEAEMLEAKRAHAFLDGVGGGRYVPESHPLTPFEEMAASARSNGGSGVEESNKVRARVNAVLEKDGAERQAKQLDAMTQAAGSWSPSQADAERLVPNRSDQIMPQVQKRSRRL